MGHLSSYMHIETIARHHRMLGENVYFPFGFDDNGLPTERYVEKVIKKRAYELPRQTFINICLDETKKLEDEFFSLYKSAGFITLKHLLCGVQNVKLHVLNQN